MQTETALERLQRLLPDVFNPKPQTGDLYLRFCVAPSLYAAIPIERIVETLYIPENSITPIPNMPAHILGLMGNRSNVFWALDLGRLLDLNRRTMRIQHHHIIVVESLPMEHQGAGALWLGLSVQNVQTTLRLHLDRLNFTTEDLTPQVQPYVQGWFQHNDDKTLLLNVDAIASKDYVES